MDDFCVGDFVVLVDYDEIEENESLFDGVTGVICDTTDCFNSNVGVRWDVTKDEFHLHNCNKHCEFGYGWYVPKRSIKYIGINADEDFDAADITIDGFFN